MTVNTVYNQSDSWNVHTLDENHLKLLADVHNSRNAVYIDVLRIHKASQDQIGINVPKM